MAFQVLAKLENYEVRMVQSRTLKSGKGARFMRLESPDAAFTCEVSVWDEDMFSAVDRLVKGDKRDFRCRISAGDYEGLTLVGIDQPSNVANDDDFGF